METSNLLSSKRGDIVSKMIRTYSSGDSDRLNINESALLADDPFNMDIRLDTAETGTNRKIVDKYLSLLDIAIDGPAEDDIPAAPDPEKKP
jgi:hypothetical protein